MNIRQFQPGDEYHQLAIYNSAGAGLPAFKSATMFEIQRRIQARGFDAATRWFAEDAGKVAAYCSFHANGRISYPWCLPGHEHVAQPLLHHVLQALKGRGIRKVFTAYRGDWLKISDFFKKEGFVHVRDMVNFILAFENMPTPPARLSTLVLPAQAADLPKIFALAPQVFRVPDAAGLMTELWDNPLVAAPDSLFVMRNRTDGSPVAAGIFITNSTYTDPRLVDSQMPCFRLGAFGTEGMTTKRIKGLFSFVARLDQYLVGLGMDLLAYAALRLSEEDDISCFAAQVASDVPPLLSFYQRHFERQGSFPVLERELG